VYEQGRGALPSSEKSQQLIDVYWRRGDLAWGGLMRVMKVKTKVAVSERRSEFGKIEGGIEQTDHALRGMHSDHLL
jgi:hypothetical protein